jgi:ABC-type Mn2+/Zn2+ transport system permease subunit
VGVTLSGAFALGVLLLSAQAGFSRDLTAYLVGSIVTVQPGDLATTAVVGAAALAVLAALHKELVLGAFDRGGLAALGYPVLALDVALLLVIEATVVTSIPAVGTILAVALIVAPAATARLWTERLRATMALAAALGAASGVVGLAISLQWRVAAGATIVLVAAALFAVSLLLAPRHGLLARHLPVGPVLRRYRRAPARGTGVVGASRRRHHSIATRPTAVGSSQGTSAAGPSRGPLTVRETTSRADTSAM